MRKCNGCQQNFPTWVTIDGKKRNLCNRKFCTTCSPFGGKNASKNPYLTQEERKALRKKNNALSVSTRRKKVIKMAVEYLGGKCKLCGYSKCIEALDFHHLNPADKQFAIGSGATKSWEKVKKEVEKCVLLCANCHREVEAGVAFL